MPPTPQALLHGLIDDAAMFPPGNAPVPQAIAAHHEHRRAPYAELVGPLLCGEQRLRELRENAGNPQNAGDPLRIGLVVSGGAGAIGPAIQHASTPERVEVVAVEIALRDEDDLARNAERIVRALDLDLPADAVASIEVPRVRSGDPSMGWLAALDEIAAAGHQLKFRTGGEDADAFPSEQELAAFIDSALDRECPFKLTAGLHRAIRNTESGHAYEQHGFLNVLLATRALLDGVSSADAAGVLAGRDAEQLADELLSWDDAVAASTRRWFASFGSCSIDEPLTDLRALGLMPS